LGPPPNEPATIDLPEGLDKEETMSYARRLLDTYPRVVTVDADVVAKAIDALNDCAQA
jgi:hypothetical protein